MTAEMLYPVAGLLVGMLVGMTGVGGGSLMTPVLVLAFGFHPTTAVGTDLLYAAATKSVGTAVHGAGGAVDWRIVRRLALGSVPATALTLAAMAWFGTDLSATGKVIGLTLGYALIATSVAILFRKQIVGYFTRNRPPRPEGQVRALTVALGVALGVLVSLSSVGAGALGMTLLLILYPTVPINRLVGSDIAHAVPLTLIAGMGHWWLGSIDFSLLGLLLLGSIPGVIAGSLIANRVAERTLRPILAVTLAVVGIKLVF